MAGAWGQNRSNAIRQPPSQGSQQQQQRSQGRNNSNSGRGGGGGSGGNRGRGGRSRGRGGGRGRRDNSRNQHHSNNNNTDLSHVKLCQPGDGTTPAQKAVARIPAQMLLNLRMAFASDAPPAELPQPVAWEDEQRLEAIQATVKDRMGGDVSLRKPKVVETAPPLEECKPLEVNEETRWKAKIFNPNEEATNEEEEESDEEILKKALLILNKLSLTKFDKLSDEFIDTGIGRSRETLEGCVGLIVEKAQSEPHFSNMYAKLCMKLAKQTPWKEEVGGKKAFKKLLLTRCQEEFEEETSQKIEAAIKDAADKEEVEYRTMLIKKAYLGHMKFLGELYKGDLLKIEVMEWCLKTLLEGEEHSKGLDEERVECFAQLMTTIGYSLQEQAATLKIEKKKSGPSEALEGIWATVLSVARGGGVSNRLKFMLLDLMELRDNGWVKRRKEETVKTLDQIHQEVAKEEAQARRQSNVRRDSDRSISSSYSRGGSERSLRRQSSKPMVDEDGFTQVMPRPQSSSSLSRAMSEGVLPPISPGMKQRPLSKRSSSFTAAPKAEPIAPSLAPGPPRPKKSYPSPQACESKAKAMLKEYFVNGETDDAVLTVDETVGAGQRGSVDRGAKFVEAGVLMVMEMKATDVEKMLVVYNRAITEGKLEKDAIVKGLSDPLEFLTDVEIDAPLARTHLATIVAAFLGNEKACLELELLLQAPEYFRTDGKAADFSARVIKKLGDGEPTATHLQVVEKLMTSKDKENHATPQELIASI